jgi:hypothetical protein
MTNAARWIALLPVLVVIVAVPFMLMTRDPLHDARRRLAAMTPSERRQIESNRDAYGELTALERFELNRLNDELAGLPAGERAALEAAMGRLQAWVATFPDDVRARYEKEMTAGKIAILKERFLVWEREKARIAATVKAAEAMARKAAPLMGMQAKVGNLKRMQERIENQVRARGTPDDQELIRLVKDPFKLKPNEKALLLGCMAAQTGGRLPGKSMGARFDPTDYAPIAMLKKFEFVPAFRRLPDDPTEGLPESNRTELVRAIPQIYLLTPPSQASDFREIMKRLRLDAPKGDGPMEPLPLYLLHQIVLLKDYAEGTINPPLKDIRRVNELLGKRP